MSSTVPVTNYSSQQEEFGWIVENWRCSPQYARFNLSNSTDEKIRSPVVLSKGQFRWQWEIHLHKKQSVGNPPAKENTEELNTSKGKPKYVVEDEVTFRCISIKWPYFFKVLRVEGTWFVKRRSNDSNSRTKTARERTSIFVDPVNVQMQHSCPMVTVMKIDYSFLSGYVFKSPSIKISAVPDKLEFSANFNISGWESTTIPCACAEEQLLNFSLLTEFHDVTVLVEGEEFPAHKAVLAARSPVLKSMLSADMLEKKENRIVMTDVSASAWRQFQKFLYSNCTGMPSDWDFAFLVEMLMLSDKYQINSLNKIVEEAIVSRMNYENVFEIIEGVEKYNLSRVMQTASNIILKNWDAIKADEKFAALLALDSDIAKALMLKLRPEQPF